jgi:hypothetical protein
MGTAEHMDSFEFSLEKQGDGALAQVDRSCRRPWVRAKCVPTMYVWSTFDLRPIFG